MTADISLPPLIDSLLTAQPYPHAVNRIRLIQTHISWIILTGDYAYKIKKPLDLGFLDFSTLARRRACCEEEIRLNRRLAPDIYLGVAAITGTATAPGFGVGEPIEYAVKMRQFAQAAQLDKVLARGELRAAHIDAFARVIAGFHQQLEGLAPDGPHGSRAAIYQAVHENFVALRDCLAHGPVARRLNTLESWSEKTFATLGDRLEARRRDGFVRECHGDLHLRNLAWVDNQPLAFDCIEFNPDLRWIDIQSDIAFLVMDLQARGQPRFAMRFLNTWLERGGDYTGLDVLRFYLVYRAMVRAKVDAIRASQPDAGDDERREAEQDCVTYLSLAREYTRPGSPRLIIMRGVSASGKTTVSQELLETLAAVRIRSDVERKRLFGLEATQSGAAAPGEGIYAREAGERTYARLRELADQVLSAGFTVIVDAAFLQAEQRRPFQLLAAERGVDYAIAECHAPEAELRKRIVSRQRGASDAGLAVLENQLKNWQPLGPDEKRFALAP